MSEGVKTIVFTIIALVVAVAAVVSRPRQEEFNVSEEKGKPLFEKFDDPSKAASMEIVEYDDEMGQISTFKVARDKKSGAWVIPSHAGYPADAEDRMRDAALMLVDLQVLDVASQMTGEHSLFGVIAPDKEKLSVGDEGVGLLLAFEDKKGQDVAGLIVGKKVKGAEDQRFVRIPKQDAVYVVKIDPDKLSTEFEDWIEKDLLQLSSWDIEDVTIKNYSVDLAMSPPIQRKFDFASQYKDAEWKLLELTQYSENQPIAGALGPNEELDKDKLNDFKNAVDELKIVDVFRKPDGLGRDLKAGEDFTGDSEGEKDLFKRGYYLTRDTRELVSASGEVHVGMKDGVEYVLRFGEELAGSGDDDEDAETEQNNRYLFAMARVNMAKLPAPELEDLPELPEGATVDTPSDDEGDDAKGTDTDSSSSETAAESTAADDAESTETSEDDSSGADDAADEESAESDAKEGEDADADDDMEAKEAEIVKERERISKENERKLNEYNEKVNKAKEKVAELNTRFGDWYYVVSDEQCKKIFLGLDELIKKKETEDVEGDGVDAFRNLQEEGLKKDEED